MTRTVLITIEIVAASIWIGSLVCLALVSGVARRVLDGPDRVTFFRGVGRLYARVGTGSLLVAIAAGVAIGWPPADWTSSTKAALALSIVLVSVTAAGMAQAQQMTLRRRRALAAPQDRDAAKAVERGAALADALRAAIGAVTLAIVVLCAHVLAR
jgi:uncharacterized membrane protein